MPPAYVGRNPQPLFLIKQRLFVCMHYTDANNLMTRRSSIFDTNSLLLRFSGIVALLGIPFKRLPMAVENIFPVYNATRRGLVVS